VARPRRFWACLFFLRARSSPSGQRWQNSQSFALRQLPGLQNHAHGRQLPVLWRSDPKIGCACGVRGLSQGAGLLPPDDSFSCGLEEQVVDSRSESEEQVVLKPGGRSNASSKLLFISSSSSEAKSIARAISNSGRASEDDLGVAKPKRNMVCFVFFRFLISPSGQRWQ